MNIEIRNPKSEIRGLPGHAGRTAFGFPCLIPGTPHLSPRHGFTLIEVLLALVVLAIVMVVVHSVFYSAIQLRNKAEQAFTDAVPLQHTLAVIKRDLENITVPGGTLSGTFQTTLTTGSSSTAALAHNGQQCGPVFYTAAGTLDDNQPWSEMRKVTYYLMPPTNNNPGLDLVRSVTRNLLPVATEEYQDQVLMSGVNNLELEYYDGNTWQTTWDSTTTTLTTSSNTLPKAVKIELTLVTDEHGTPAGTPIEMVVPIVVEASTNSTSSTGGSQ
jgi:type II secretion system protein J